MKKLFLLTLALLAAATAGAQIHLEGYRQSDIAPRWTEGRWDARWISVPGEPLNAYGVYLFRKTLNLPSKPERYVVHVSADNRYKLYVNGHLVSLGPARGDIYNWNYETVDLSPWLRQGDNTLAAEVWNFVEWEADRADQLQSDRTDRSGQRPRRAGRQYGRQLEMPA